VASTRGAEVLVSLLGAVFRGILCSDRWVVYLTYHSGRMQLCWHRLCGLHQIVNALLARL
jgi:hypothetical protein